MTADVAVGKGNSPDRIASLIAVFIRAGNPLKNFGEPIRFASGLYPIKQDRVVVFLYIRFWGRGGRYGGEGRVRIIKIQRRRGAVLRRVRNRHIAVSTGPPAHN